MNENYERKLCTVSSYIKEFLTIVEIENKKCHIYSKWKTPIESVSDILIMSLDGLHTSISRRQIYNPKNTILAKNHSFECHISYSFRESFFEYVPYEIFSSGNY